MLKEGAKSKCVERKVDYSDRGFMPTTPLKAIRIFLERLFAAAGETS